MPLTLEKKRELRELGWIVSRRKAKRPESIPTSDVLYVGEDLTLEQPVTDPTLVHLDSHC